MWGQSPVIKLGGGGGDTSALTTRVDALDARTSAIEAKNLDARTSAIESKNLDARIEAVETTNVAMVSDFTGISQKVYDLEMQNLPARMSDEEFKSQNAELRITNLESSSGGSAAQIYTWVWPSAAERMSVAITSDDVGKVGFQIDIGLAYEVTFTATDTEADIGWSPLPDPAVVVTQGEVPNTDSTDFVGLGITGAGWFGSGSNYNAMANNGASPSKCMPRVGRSFGYQGDNKSAGRTLCFLPCKPDSVSYRVAMHFVVGTPSAPHAGGGFFCGLTTQGFMDKPDLTGAPAIRFGVCRLPNQATLTLIAKNAGAVVTYPTSFPWLSGRGYRLDILRKIRGDWSLQVTDVDTVASTSLKIDRTSPNAPPTDDASWPVYMWNCGTDQGMFYMEVGATFISYRIGARQ